MPDLPEELRDRAARAAFDKFSGTVGFGAAVVDNFFQKEADRWRAVVDAVAEVLAEHPAEEQRPLAKTVDGRCRVASECWLAWERDTDTRIELYMKYARKEIELARTTRKDLRVRADQLSKALREMARRNVRGRVAQRRWTAMTIGLDFQQQDEIDALRVRAECAEADLARARNLASEVLHLMRFRLDGRPMSIGEAHTLIAWSRGVLASGPAGAAHTEED